MNTSCINQEDTLRTAARASASRSKASWSLRCIRRPTTSTAPFSRNSRAAPPVRDWPLHTRLAPLGRPEPGRTFVHGADDGYLLSPFRGYRRGRRRREFWEAHSRRVALRLRCGEARLLRRTSRFTCKLAQNKEPTSGFEPLTCSLQLDLSLSI